MRPKDYIGITGFMSRYEVDAVMDCVPDGSDALFMIGVLASNKTIVNKPNRFPMRYPKPEALGTIFDGRPGVLNLVHFNSKATDVLLCDMAYALRLAGPHCHGFQVNVPWPEKFMLDLIRTPDYSTEGQRTIVLQCGKTALSLLDWDPTRIAAKVAEYAHLIEYALIDPSGGTGTAVDLAFARDCCLAILDRTDSVGVGMAGGLDAENLLRLEPLRSEFPFSIDVESRVRDQDDRLSASACRRYLTAALQLFGNTAPA